MKTTRLFLFIGLLGASAMFTSCQKTYTCKCTINDIELKTATINSKNKKDATNKCHGLEVHSNEICKLK